jgi:multidrug efflux pump subunit AcrA (membrane-fusion protein)
MTRLEELEAKRAAAEAAVNAAADTAWDEADAAYAAYDAAWDAVDAYKAELKKQQGERNGVMTEAFKSIEQGLKEAIAKYAVWVEVDTNEGMYVSADRPFTYASDPLLFDDKAAAEEHAKLWMTGKVVEYPKR